ncbi:hypothetical protein NUW58_g4967 [Xylaria curta]|uniref:Uncharacterized protein n=1 Tax=Xylaria curta TaxID=42375 RepID=A0ACC1P5H9_9PEZI|nr:hypothetical protein NUW58_g4967 [Xylaria curta]
MRFSVAFLFPLLPLIHGQRVAFVSPEYQRSDSTASPYEGNSRWPLGSTQVVAFSTPWEEYRLEFWQQDPSSGGILSSEFNYTQTAGNQRPQSFQWTVQTYEFQLSRSPIFFFWLFNSANSSLQQSSAYFNITINGASSSSTKTTTTRTTSRRTTLPTSSVLTGPTTTYTVTFSASTTSTPTSDASSGLSTGAAAGIGVGASLGGIAVLGLAGLVYFKRRKSRTEPQRSELPASKPLGYPIEPPKPEIPMSQYSHSPRPVEAPSHYEHHPAELGS